MDFWPEGHEFVSKALFGRNVEQVAATPTKVFGDGVQQTVHRFGVSFGMQVTKTRRNAFVAHLHQVAHKWMDMSVKYSWIKVIFWLESST
jgi:hypothetical protein